MPRFLVVAAPVASGAAAQTLLWFPVPEASELRVREARPGLEGLDADPDFGRAVGATGTTRLLPPLDTKDQDRAPVRLELATAMGVTTVRVPAAADRAPGAPATLLDLGVELDAEPRPLLVGQVVLLGRERNAGYRALLVEAAATEDPEGLARGLTAGAASLEALPERMLDLAFGIVRVAVASGASASGWREVDVALRERRAAREPFLAGLDGARRAAVAAAWDASVRRVLGRLGHRTAWPLSERGRDWFVLARAAIERVRGFPQLSRDGFAAGVAHSLDALGEEPGNVRLVPLAREGRREVFRLTLSRRNDPEYRLFDVTRTETGDAIVSGRRLVRADPEQRVRTIKCLCGGRLFEGDSHCRGCAKKIDDMGAVAIGGTFILGATAAVVGMCGCGAPVGAEDRFCGGCGRSLEEWS